MDAMGIGFLGEFDDFSSKPFSFFVSETSRPPSHHEVRGTPLSGPKQPEAETVTSSMLL